MSCTDEGFANLLKALQGIDGGGPGHTDPEAVDC